MLGEPWHVARPHRPVLQPQGITLARIDGPTTDDVTMRESGECEITPSTDVKYPQGSITSMRNQWLLIGADPRRAPGAVVHPQGLRWLCLGSQPYPSPGCAGALTLPMPMAVVLALWPRLQRGAAEARLWRCLEMKPVSGWPRGAGHVLPEGAGGLALCFSPLAAAAPGLISGRGRQAVAVAFSAALPRDTTAAWRAHATRMSGLKLCPEAGWWPPQLCLPLAPGHHELPPVVHTTMLRAFPENLRKTTETIIPRSSPARTVFDNVSGGALPGRCFAWGSPGLCRAAGGSGPSRVVQEGPVHHPASGLSWEVREPECLEVPAVQPQRPPSCVAVPGPEQRGGAGRAEQR